MEEGLTPVSPIKNPGLVAVTTLELVVLLLLARAYTVPLPRETVKVLPLCQLSGVLSVKDRAYSKVPPLPLADKLTVAVVFADAGLLNVTLEAVGANTVTAACLSRKKSSVLLSPVLRPEMLSRVVPPVATVLTTVGAEDVRSISALFVKIFSSLTLAVPALEVDRVKVTVSPI